MKVVAIIANQGYSTGRYMCEVSLEEIQKFLGIYYGSDKPKSLEVGQVIDLGKGFDHAQQIESALSKTREFIAGHHGTVQAILNGLRVERATEAAAK